MFVDKRGTCTGATCRPSIHRLCYSTLAVPIQRCDYRNSRVYHASIQPLLPDHCGHCVKTYEIGNSRGPSTHPLRVAKNSKKQTWSRDVLVNSRVFYVYVRLLETNCRSPSSTSSRSRYNIDEFSAISNMYISTTY